MHSFQKQEGKFFRESCRLGGTNRINWKSGTRFWIIFIKNLKSDIYITNYKVDPSEKYWTTDIFKITPKFIFEVIIWVRGTSYLEILTAYSNQFRSFSRVRGGGVKSIYRCFNVPAFRFQGLFKAVFFRGHNWENLYFARICYKVRIFQNLFTFMSKFEPCFFSTNKKNYEIKWPSHNPTTHKITIQVRCPLHDHLSQLCRIHRTNWSVQSQKKSYHLITIDTLINHHRRQQINPLISQYHNNVNLVNSRKPHRNSSHSNVFVFNIGLNFARIRNEIVSVNYFHKVST